jgi:hypothetical protein
MVPTIDHDDFGIAMSQRFCGGNTAKATADNHNAGLIVAHLRLSRQLLA